MTRQNKLQDPTEAAMSAIEEALRLDQPKGDDTADTSELKLPSTADSDLKLALPRVEAAPPKTPTARPETARPETAKAEAAEPAPPPRPAIAPDTSRVANDDRRDSSSLVQAFSVRPSGKPYW